MTSTPDTTAPPDAAAPTHRATDTIVALNTLLPASPPVGPGTVIGALTGVVGGVGALIAALSTNDTATITSAIVGLVGVVGALGGRFAVAVARVRSIAQMTQPLVHALAQPEPRRLLSSAPVGFANVGATDPHGAEDREDVPDESSQGDLARFDGDVPEDADDVPSPAELEAAQHDEDADIEGAVTGTLMARQDDEPPALTDAERAAGLDGK